MALLVAVAGGACTAPAADEVTTITSSITTHPTADTATAVESSSTLPTVTSVTTTTSGSDSIADLVVRGGSILTMSDSTPGATAVAVVENRIVAVVSDEEASALIGPHTIVVELDGRALLPGFVDAHSHYYGTAFSENWEPGTTQELMLESGLTSVAELAVDETLLEEMRRLDEEGEIRVRSSAYLLGDTSCGELTGDWQLAIPPTREPGERFRIGGIKLYTDGGSCNAPAVSYEHAFGGNGDLYFSAEEVAGLIQRYDDAGYQVATHALGDRAIEATLDGLEMVIGDSDNPLRHRIEHNAVVPPEMRGRYDEVGAVATIFGAFGTCAYLGLDDRFQFSTPVENQEWEWPWREVLDLNPDTVFAWHGDFPVFDDSTPIASLAGFVTRSQTLEDGTHCEPEPYHLKHAITVQEALHLLTAGAAYALDRDAEVGSIEVGKLADLIILSDDPRSIPSENLIHLRVELTILDGEPAHCEGVYASLCDEPVFHVGSLTASRSLPTNPPEHAVDGDLDTHWGSGGDAPQWIEIPVDSGAPVTLVRLVVDQHPPGVTRHIISGRTDDGNLVQLAVVEDRTEMFDSLEVKIEEPVAVVAIRVETVQSPSWISWREIEISQGG